MENINKKTTILLSAAKVFAKDGFEKATIDDIIKKAKIAKGTVYYYFNSKEEIFNAIVSEAISTFDKKTKESISASEDVVSQLEAFIETEKNYILKYRDVFTVFVGELIKKARSFKQLEQIIDRGKKEKLIRNDIDTKFISDAIFWMVAMTTINGQTKFQKEFALKGILL
jgi:AcrR family transcriptional regulator